MPQMTSEHLKKLRERVRPGGGVIPQTECGFEPLCAFYPAEALQKAKENLIAGESLQILAQKLVECGLAEIYEIETAELSLYWNVNTPHDLSSAG